MKLIRLLLLAVFFITAAICPALRVTAQNSVDMPPLSLGEPPQMPEKNNLLLPPPAALPLDDVKPGLLYPPPKLEEETLKSPEFGPVPGSDLPASATEAPKPSPGLREKALASDLVEPQNSTAPQPELTKQYTQELLDALEMQVLQETSQDAAEPKIEDSFTIRLFLFKERDNALKALTDIESRGYDAVVSEVALDDCGLAYTVQIGGFKSYQEAESAAFILADSEKREVHVLSPALTPEDARSSAAAASDSALP